MPHPEKPTSHVIKTCKKTILSIIATIRLTSRFKKLSEKVKLIDGDEVSFLKTFTQEHNHKFNFILILPHTIEQNY